MGRSLDQDLGRGSYAAFRHLEAILRLTQYCEQNRPNYGAMTDEELERAIGELGGRPEGKALSSNLASNLASLIGAGQEQRSYAIFWQPVNPIGKGYKCQLGKRIDHENS